MIGNVRVWTRCNAEDTWNCEGEVRLSPHGWFCGWHTAILEREAKRLRTPEDNIRFWLSDEAMQYD
jgi:hypothetical protein